MRGNMVKEDFVTSSGVTDPSWDLLTDPVAKPVEVRLEPRAAGAKFPISARLRAESHRLIPGGAHTYAKGDDQYPEDAPSFIERGKGCYVWDCDGNRFIEYGSGLRSITLGHAYAPVIEAAAAQMQLGANFVRPARLELQLAERFLGFIGQPDSMVKFAKNGSDCTTAAVKLARAYTGRDYIAICGDQPFFSTDDWFIGATPMHSGIPQAVRDLTLRFRYNDLASIEALFSEHPGQVAAIILEAATADAPAPGFLEGAKALCHKHGAVFIIDETITGFRCRKNSAQLFYGVRGDLSIWGKGIANGFALSALVGEPHIMNLGGINHERPRLFLLSTTHGAESHAMAACIAVMDEYDRIGATELMHQQGEKLKAGVLGLISQNNLQGYVDVVGPGANLAYVTCDREGRRSQVYRTIFMQEMIAQGLLGPSFVINCAHDDSAIDQTLSGLEKVLPVYARAIADGPERFLKGRPVKPVWRSQN